ncbi:hypothetical protein Trydic_g14175 [Trypoxylus dichotomus]
MEAPSDLNTPKMYNEFFENALQFQESVIAKEKQLIVMPASSLPKKNGKSFVKPKVVVRITKWNVAPTGTYKLSVSRAEVKN